MEDVGVGRIKAKVKVSTKGTVREEKGEVRVITAN